MNFMNLIFQSLDHYSDNAQSQNFNYFQNYFTICFHQINYSYFLLNIANYYYIENFNPIFLRWFFTFIFIITFVFQNSEFGRKWRYTIILYFSFFKILSMQNIWVTEHNSIRGRCECECTTVNIIYNNLLHWCLSLRIIYLLCWRVLSVIQLI